ncbi:MAG: hypothetical protein GY739_15770 [Mesoflavibacter sp.]|nr:hypothetical protein [Mesoflavibacter sp.]
MGSKKNNINNNLFDIELTNNNNDNGQKHDNNIMDSINNENENENENKIDPNLIANNSADIVWIESSERKYKTTKSSINYDMRIYIDIPYEAEGIKILIKDYKIQIQNY